MTKTPAAAAHPPETAEGWYVLHQIFTVDRKAWRALSPDDRRAHIGSARTMLERIGMAQPGGGGMNSGPNSDVNSGPGGGESAGNAPGRNGPNGESDEGWTAAAELVGSRGDLMLMHCRPTLDALREAQETVLAEPLSDYLTLVYSFLSVTEAGLYHLTAQLAREVEAEGGAFGDKTYQARLAERSQAERDTAHVQKRLYPRPPAGMPYVCFYPMSKRRDAGQNWYTLALDERSRLMMVHGLTGRRYAGRVLQIISGAIGLDTWEWGVTLFAKDPLVFKKLVTDMRFDEVSAKYAEFGEFYVGKLVPPALVLETIA